MANNGNVGVVLYFVEIGNRQGEEQFDRAGALFLGPEPHARSRHEEEEEPRVPDEEILQRSLATVEERAGHEGEESRHQQEDDDEDIGYG